MNAGSSQNSSFVTPVRMIRKSAPNTKETTRVTTVRRSILQLNEAELDEVNLSQGEVLILQKVEAIARDVDLIKKTIESQNKIDEDSDAEDDIFPLDSKESLEELNVRLAEKTLRKKYVRNDNLLRKW
jgi:hypothetical protein